MSTPQAPDPTSYSTITLAGKEYEIRLSILDVISLEKQGVDILRNTDFDKPLPSGEYPSLLERSFKIIAQGIHAGLSASEVAELVGLDGMMSAIPKVAEAIKKVAAQIGGAASAPVPQAPSVQ